MLFLIIVILNLVKIIFLKEIDKCNNLDCDDERPVCGIRQEGDGFRLKLFENECDLLKDGCRVDDAIAYGIANMFYCDHSFNLSSLQTPITECTEFDCSRTDAIEVCGIRNDKDGFKVRIFKNKCQLNKHNCENEIKYSKIDYYICNSTVNTESITNNEVISDTTESVTELIDVNIKNIIIVDNVINYDNINDSIDNFFAATHVFDLPVRDVGGEINETTRRMLIKNAGPIKVFKPWIKKPKNVSEDFYHMPTLSSCFHKCPTKCPPTYAPVCGVPGIVAREPSLMFQNHCFMDVAQCKMFWEDKSPTATSSNYIESSFLFCLGDEMNGLYRFLPLIRTLQHMGRLKKKGHFRYKFKNMRFFNNLLSREPKYMGK